MKTLLLTLTIAATAPLAQGQGTIGFNNGASSRVLICADGLFWRYANASDGLQMGIFIGADEFSLRGLPEMPLAIIQPGNADGIFTVPGGTVYSVGWPAGFQPFAQVRVWGIEFGSDWYAGLMGSPWRYGESDIRQLSPLGPPTGPGTVIWQSATGTNPNRFRPLRVAVPLSGPCVPEPTVLGVFALSGLMFGLNRWRSSRRT
jgi:hypothetical protein